MKKLLQTCILSAAWATSAAPHGKLCLTFDDRFFDSWIKADEVFKKYDAHVTFFVYGKIDQEAVSALKQLQAAGHTIGLHALTHAKMTDGEKQYSEMEYTQKEIIPQLEICKQNNIKIRAFAYPFSRRNADTDKELFKTFDFLRSNCNDVKAPEQPLEKADGCFVKEVKKKQLFYGFPASGDFNIDEVKAAMRRAAEENSVLVFYAHNITENMNKSHHISCDQLTKILEYAKELKMSVCGMNEL